MRVSLDHAHIFASDTSATVQFFQAMFDAAIVWDESAAGVRVIRLRLGRAFINIYDQPPRGPRGGAVHHLGIETDDLAGLIDRMTARGFVFRNPVRHDKAFNYVMVAGPDDLLIELFECHEPDRWGIRKGDQPMPDVIAEVTTEVLQAFADAWNRHDVDALMSFMTDDCVFEASAGSEVCGTRYAGREAVRAGFAEVWATFPDAHWGSARHFVQGDRGVSEWIFTGTRADGTRVEVHGCDVFTFRDGKIALKNSYRKNRPLLSTPTG